MTETDLEHVTGGTKTLAQCFDDSHAAWLPASGGGALLGYALRGTSKATVIGTALGFASAVGAGCLNT